jgi:hypothetical protein
MLQLLLKKKQSKKSKVEKHVLVSNLAVPDITPLCHSSRNSVTEMEQLVTLSRIDRYVGRAIWGDHLRPVTVHIITT